MQHLVHEICTSMTIWITQISDAVNESPVLKQLGWSHCRSSVRKTMEQRMTDFASRMAFKMWKQQESVNLISKSQQEVRMRTRAQMEKGRTRNTISSCNPLDSVNEEYATSSVITNRIRTAFVTTRTCLQILTLMLHRRTWECKHGVHGNPELAFTSSCYFHLVAEWSNSCARIWWQEFRLENALRSYSCLRMKSFMFFRNQRQKLFKLGKVARLGDEQNK